MKAQTKAIVASVVVIALALTAVSGVTYSWFSDTDSSNIEVTTGIVDVRTTLSGNTPNVSVTSSSAIFNACGSMIMKSFHLNLIVVF